MNWVKAPLLSSEKQDSFQNLSIVNFDCDNAQKNDSTELFQIYGVLYVLSPTEGSFIFFLHINEHYRSKGLGTLLLQNDSKANKNACVVRYSSKAIRYIFIL